MNGVISLGEALVDFIPVDDKNVLFEKNPGGAPANVAVGLSKLDTKTAFIGKVGNDVLGSFLYDRLDKEGVNLNNMVLTDEAKTALTIVTLDKTGDRSFDFFVKPSADRLLKKEEIDEELFEDHKIFHFGSISMINEISREATQYALQLAIENNMYVSYDPNLRESLWKDLEQAKKIIKSVLGSVNILKVSKEELEFLTGLDNITEGAEQIKNKNELDIVLVTDGPNGVYFYKDKLIHVPSQKVEAVDTTGAGDAFVSAFLNRIDETQVELTKISNEKIKNYCEFANHCSALVVKKQGAMSMLPKKEEVIEFLE
ncbi:MAG: carbohydrate kinase [Halanaerobiales bacterium]|nr:carbohydrate kinase [Halanaerobiales bacterium]